MTHTNTGYFRQPSLYQDRIVFVCETDLWLVKDTGGAARRLTAHQYQASWPRFSPDGTKIAFVAEEEGVAEVYVIPADGGEAKRLSFDGGVVTVCGFTPDGLNVVYASHAGSAFMKHTHLWCVPIEGGVATQMGLGPGRRLSYRPTKAGGADTQTGAMVLTRREQEIAHWKRYRGGTKGDLWIDTDGKGQFTEILGGLQGNLAHPCWVGERIYFLSDHEGYGNVYSSKQDGSDVRSCTNHRDFYARALHSDGQRLVYQCGAFLYLYDPALNETRRIDIEHYSSRPQTLRRFVSAARYLTSYALHPEGHSLLVTTRGKSFAMGNWERDVVQLGERDGVRYRLTSWLHTGDSVVTVSDAGGEEALEVHLLHDEHGLPVLKTRLEGLDIGRPLSLAASPVENVVVLSNHRSELIYVNLDTGELKQLDTSNYDQPSQARFSPCGRYVAYAATKENPFSQIFVADLDAFEVHTLTRPVGYDRSPSWDPEGRYLYFISGRVFDPVYDALRFDLGFPRGSKPYLVTLRRDLESPFHPLPKPLDASSDKKDIKKATKARGGEPDAAAANSGEGADGEMKTPSPRVKTPIDFTGIDNRIIEFPIGDGRYLSLQAAKSKVFFSEAPIEGSLGRGLGGEKPQTRLHAYDLDLQKSDIYAEGISSFTLSQDGKALGMRTKEGKVRIVKSGVKPDMKETRPGRSSGFVDLERIKVSVLPVAEWRQMFREMWRLQREHFWTTDMSQVDWPAVYERYLPILDKVATRAEFSDLAWEVQGELGTSHAYERGGDQRLPPSYFVGKLGAEFSLESGIWKIRQVLVGDSWDRSQDSPLHAPGIGVEAGDEILAIDGQRLTPDTVPSRFLVNKAGVDVALVLRKAETQQLRRVTVKPLASEMMLRYRHWVESNRAMVAERSGGRIGYVHVPDMGARGYSEFYRYYLLESYRHGLIVDVRFNGGGHVSQFLLEKLSRRRVSYMVSHHLKPLPEPHYSVDGPIVCLTNEFAGSDGDIFSHSFKLLKLGTLVGKRTWGGVIGIDARNTLVDGTLVTQPEYSTWFKDVGWGLENYGTDPDIEVDIPPQDYARGFDTQLEKALAVALEQLEQYERTGPDFGPRPNLAPPLKV